MSLIFCALIYVFIDSRFIEPVKVTKAPKFKPKEVAKERGIEVIEISGKNESEVAPKRIRRLDSDEADRSPDSQKLVFLPGRPMKPSRVMEKPKVNNFPSAPPNHRISSRMSDPRPFNHMMGAPHPNGFQRAPQTTARSFHNQVHNIQDIIRQNQVPVHQRHPQRFPMTPARYNGIESTSMYPVQLAGTYRHPRKNGELSQIFNPTDYPKHSQTHQEMVPDPFHNYKPGSPYEVNQMAMMNGMKLMGTMPTQNPYFRRQFKHQIASIPNYNIRSKDATGIYQNVLNSGKHFQVDRNEEQRQKPFSMMLDVYPAMGGTDGMETNQMQQMQQMQQPLKKPRMKPFQGYYQDPSYFNTMQFPQLMPRYPAYFRYQQPQPQASNMHSLHMKPSQLVVHLNLYPKNKQTLKRSSNEDEITTKKNYREKVEQQRSNLTEAPAAPVNINFNVNTNGHPENILHQANLPRDPYQNYSVTTEPTFKPSYYYDESDDDQSIMVSPSLVYHNIHRDRPTHLMLRNSTTTTEIPKKKLKNHKHIYQTIERPQKQQKIKSELKNYGNIYQ